MKSAIEQEIIWCENHRGESGKGKDFEDGFLAGLKQALRFEDTVRVFEVESSNLSTPIEPEHIFDSMDCWCHPQEIFEANNGSKVIVHKGHGEELPPAYVIAEAIADAMRST